jgi:hypothetical protein
VKTKFIIFFLFLFGQIEVLFSQPKINSYWVMSQNNVLIFGDSLTVQTNGNIGLSECCSSICDSTGNLLFYTDGLKVWNRYHKIVKNSEGLGFPQINFNTSRQGVLLLQTTNDEVFLINTDYQGRPGGVNYSIININGNSDSGEVVVKKKQLFKSTNEAITAINHLNNQDIWILAHDVLVPNKFYKLLLTKDGLVTCINEQLVGPTNYTGLLDGQTIMKFSPDGRYLVRTVGKFTVLELYKFDRLTGELTFVKVVEPRGNSVFISGVEFSKNSEFLYYVKRDSSIIQYNIDLGTKEKLSSFTDEYPQQIQITPFNNIIVAIPYKKYYSTIEKIEGDDAYYKDSSIYLMGNESFADLPNFNQSYFHTPSIDYQYEMNCLSNSIQFWGKDTFGATTHLWSITKQGQATEAVFSTKNITHSFLDTGKYEVTYIASKGQRSDTMSKTITLHPKINKSFLGSDTVYAQGSAFNLTLKAPNGMHCQLWQDSSGLSSFQVDTAGIYYCKVTNQSFCQYTDSIIIKACINNLSVPSIYRVKDSMFTSHPNADSFVWYRNNEVYQITKVPYLKLTDTGIYRVEAAKQDHCNRSSATYAVKKLGIQALSIQDFNIQVFPNPSSRKVYIQSDKNFKCTIYDAVGKWILNASDTAFVELQSGMYTFVFEVEGYRVVEKVLVY